MITGKPLLNSAKDIRKQAQFRFIPCEVGNAATKAEATSMAGAAESALENIKKNKLSYEEAIWQEFQDNAKEADEFFRPVIMGLWPKASKTQRIAAFLYTLDDHYKNFNMPLRNFDPKTGKFVGPVAEKFEKGYYNLMQSLTELISKSKYNEDVVLYRGVKFTDQKLDNFFQYNTQLLKNITEGKIPIEDFKSKIIGKTRRDEGFFSASALREGGFIKDDPINIMIRVPREAQMIYTEPFSAANPIYTGKNRIGVNWNGISSQHIFSNEMELLLQRGSEFLVNDVQKIKVKQIYKDVEKGKLVEKERLVDKLFFDLTLIDQQPRAILGREIRKG